MHDRTNRNDKIFTKSKVSCIEYKLSIIIIKNLHQSFLSHIIKYQYKFHRIPDK